MWIPGWCRFAHVGAAAALWTQRGLPGEHSLPTLHVISMQDASTLPDKQPMNEEGNKNLVNGTESCTWACPLALWGSNVILTECYNDVNVDNKSGFEADNVPKQVVLVVVFLSIEVFCLKPDDIQGRPVTLGAPVSWWHHSVNNACRYWACWTGKPDTPQRWFVHISVLFFVFTCTSLSFLQLNEAAPASSYLVLRPRAGWDNGGLQG